MRIKNTTDYPDYFLRRMISWCASKVEIPVGKVLEASFGRRADGFTSGRAWYVGMRIHVSLGEINIDHPPACPHTKTRMSWSRDDAPVIYHRPSWPHNLAYDSQVDDLVSVTAHELFHLYAHIEGIKSRRSRWGGSSESQTRWHEKRILKEFQDDREWLLRMWAAPPKSQDKPPLDPLDKERAGYRKAQEALTRWRSKLKLAKTKVAKYEAKKRQYERAIAAKSSK